MNSSEDSARSDTRREVLSWLSQLKTPILGQLYSRAVEIADGYNQNSPDAELDMVLLGHCMRELMNSLPDALGDETLTGKKHLEDEALGHLRECLEEECDDRTFVPQDGFARVPERTAAAVDAFRKAAGTGTLAKRQNASIAATRNRDSTSPALVAWEQSQRFFMGYAHVKRSGDKRQLPRRDEVLTRLSDFEDVLVGRMGRFFETKTAMQAVLKKANRHQKDRTYAAPSENDVLGALALTGGDVLRHLFFSNLENPEWLKPLESVGTFKPRPPQGPDGGLRSWPESIYLKTVAPEKPDEVTRILLRASEPPDPAVRHAAIEIACMLPEKCAVEIAKKASEWAKEGYGRDTFLWESSDTSALILRLLSSNDGAAKKRGTSLAQECLRPRHEKDAYFFPYVYTLVPTFAYHEAMGRIAEKLGNSKQRGMLCSFALQLLPKNRATESLLAVPSVERACQSPGDSVENEIAYRLSSAIESALEEDSDEAVTWLEKKIGNPLAVRCGMHALRCLLDRTPRGALPECVASCIRDLTAPDAIASREYDPELYPLLRSAIEKGVVESSEVRGIAEKTLEPTVSLLRKNHPGAPEDLARLARYQQHRTLSLIGPELMGEDGRSLLEELSQEFPDARHSENALGLETVVGPNSPIKTEEMLGLGAEGLMNHLESWHPTPHDEERLVSHEGQGRALAAAVASSPALFSGMTDGVASLRPTYQRSIVSGWRQAVEERVEIPMDDALATIQRAAIIPGDATFPAEGDPFDDDGDYSALRRECAVLARSLIESEDLQLTGGQADSMLDSLIQLAKDDALQLHEEQRAVECDEDPLESSLNLTRSMALAALLRWVERYPGNPRAEEALSAIERHLPDRSASLADAAAIGVHVPDLARSAQGWLTQNLGRIFGTPHPNKGQQVALTALLGTHHPGRPLFELLSPVIESALRDNPAAYALGVRPLQETGDGLSIIGNWIYGGYAAGYIGIGDRLIETWWNEADGEHLGAAISYLCRSLRRYPSVGEVSQRVGALWDRHADQLAKTAGDKAVDGMEELALSGCFDAEWWGPRMLREYEANTSKRKMPITLIGDKLSELSETDADLAASILLLIAESDANPIGHLYRKVAGKVLGAVKERHGGILTEEAQRCMDILGEAGLADLDSLLESK